MAGLEIVVRPVVFPDIRPAPAQPIAPADDPEQGFTEIKGNGAKHIDLSNSYSASTSTGKEKEIKRQVDEARVYQKDDVGTINRTNFLDVEVANKIWMNRGKMPTTTFKGFTGDDVVPTIPGRGYTGDDIAVQNYAPIKEKDNIEVRKRNIIKRPDEE